MSCVSRLLLLSAGLADSNRLSILRLGTHRLLFGDPPVVRDTLGLVPTRTERTKVSPASKPSRRARRKTSRRWRSLPVYRQLALGLAGVSVGLLVLSLKDLTIGISSTTGQNWVFALLLAIAIDAGFVLTKLAAVSVAGRPVAKTIAGLVRLTVGGLLVMSAYYNAKEFWNGGLPNGMWAGRVESVVLGVLIPALMFAFSQIAAKLWLYGSKRGTSDE